MTLPIRWLRGAGLAAAFSWAAIWSVRLAQAHYWARLQTVESTRKAIALTPGQAEYYWRLSRLLADSDPPRARAALQRGVELDGWDAKLWIDLALDNETAGEYAAAEACLLQAAHVDRQYLPRWTLANFYFRRGDTDRFWRWAKSSAEMLYGDPLPLFRLCGNVLEDGRLPQRLGLRTPELRARYLNYMLDRGDLALIGPAVQSVIDSQRSGDTPLLLSACDRLLEQNRVAGALEIWNALAGAHRIPYGVLDPAVGEALTNQGFAIPPRSHGFDWRLAALAGVTASREESPSGLRLTFSGKQPEVCEPLSQVAPVREGQRYLLTSRYQSPQARPDTGLRWRVTAANGTILGESPALRSGAPSGSDVRFSSPKGCQKVRVSLVYQRMPGTVRWEGSIVLLQASVRAEP